MRCSSEVSSSCKRIPSAIPTLVLVGLLLIGGTRLTVLALTGHHCTWPAELRFFPRLLPEWLLLGLSNSIVVLFAAAFSVSSELLG